MSERRPRLARIQRVDGPFRDHVCLGIRLEEERPEGSRKLFILVNPGGASTAASRPQGTPADGFIRRLRNLIGNANLLAVQQHKHSTRLLIQTRDATLTLGYESRTHDIVLRSTTGEVIASRRAATPRAEGDPWVLIALDALPAWSTPKEEGDRRLRTKLRSMLKRVARTRVKVEAEFARGSEAEQLRERAGLILSNLHQPLKNGVLEIDDWTTSPPSKRSIPIEGCPKNTAEKLFHKARRYERGQSHAARRLSELTKRRAELETLLGQIDQLEETALATALASIGLRSPSPQRRKQTTERLPYRTFQTPAGRILVGRGARDNDELTLRIAKPNDRWLHVRERAGSHVIIPLSRGQVAPPTLVIDAALLAAHFSKSSTEDSVDVTHAERRHIRKPRGSAPGAVVVKQAKTVGLRMDSARIRWLLERELR